MAFDQFPPHRGQPQTAPESIRPGFPLPQHEGPRDPLPVKRLRPTKQRIWLHVLLFVLTVAGAAIFAGPVYAVCLMSILTAHECGHYFAARRYRVKASLPYFIPSPFIFGTMGAVIRMSPYIPNRRALFDIAAAGPLAGMALAAPLSLVGVLLSERVVLEAGQAGLVLGDPILFQIIERIIFGPRAPGEDLLLHNAAFAGWVGLFVTALNLLPIGQLDGGHISYAVFGQRSWLFAKLAFGGLLLMTLATSKSYTLFLVLLLLLGMKHPPTMNDAIPLDPARRKIAWLLVVTFILCFTPTPLEFDFGKAGDQPSTEKAMNSSPEFVFPLPPPAAIATNCLPSAS